MKSLLLYKNSDYDPLKKLPWNEHALMQDLELDTLFRTMSLENNGMYDVVKNVILSGVENDVETILYRQEILKDCIKNPSVVKEMYELTTEAIEKEKHNYWGIFSKYPTSILNRSREVLFMFADMLHQFKTVADENAAKFASEGFKRFFSMLQTELNDDYIFSIRQHLKELKFDKGILMTSELGNGNKGVHLILNKVKEVKKTWLKQMIEDYFLRIQMEHNGKQGWLSKLFDYKPAGYTFFVSSRDEGGIRALSQLKDEGVNIVANSLAQSSDHILGFFKTLQNELSFYVGCLNLYSQLLSMNEPVTFPVPLSIHQRTHHFYGLYDVSLALTMKKNVTGNDLIATDKEMIVITGANQGGKSTFLRSIGLAQLMMQSGIFVAAKKFSANICDAIFTHYKREEDSDLKSGKLDEELSRMDEIIHHITLHSLILFNESFAATNERESAEITRQIVNTLLEKHIKLFFVTHIYEFSNNFYVRQLDNVIFLRAERNTDKKRTFKIVEGEPLETSYGEDLYQRIFTK